MLEVTKFSCIKVIGEMHSSGLLCSE